MTAERATHNVINLEGLLCFTSQIIKDFIEVVAELEVING